jgi:hypothetical protein
MAAGPQLMSRPCRLTFFHLISCAFVTGGAMTTPPALNRSPLLGERAQLHRNRRVLPIRNNTERYITLITPLSVIKRRLASTKNDWLLLEVGSEKSTALSNEREDWLSDRIRVSSI